MSFGLWAGGRFPAKDLLPYIVAQTLGAILAAWILFQIASGTAGFAIDNPSLIRAGDVAALDWLAPLDNAASRAARTAAGSAPIVVVGTTRDPAHRQHRAAHCTPRCGHRATLRRRPDEPPPLQPLQEHAGTLTDGVDAPPPRRASSAGTIQPKEII